MAGPVKSREDWERFKAERLQPVLEDRLPPDWPELVAKYKQRDVPLYGPSCEHWLALVELVGLEQLLTMFYDDPNLLRDMIRYLTLFWVTMYDKLLRQVVPDMMTVGGDFCYKTGPLLSPAAFREFFLPAWQEVTSLMRSYGVPAIIVHTDGDCRRLIPEFIEGGVTGVHPWEVTNGQNIVDVRAAYPTVAHLRRDRQTGHRGRQRVHGSRTRSQGAVHVAARRVGALRGSLRLARHLLAGFSLLPRPAGGDVQGLNCMRPPEWVRLLLPG